MENYTYQNTLISKKQLKQILAWSFTEHGCVQASFLADELKYLGFKYATQAGISISIEDLRVPPFKNLVLKTSNNTITNIENTCLQGKINEIERFQKVIDTWNITSETLKDELVSYFKNYDPLNSVYIMAFSGARGNLSQVRQLVGMRGLMSDPNGQIMDLPIKQNFREGLTITDYLISGYGARKGIVDTALKTANSGYLTRRLIDVAQDIIIQEKNCLTNRSIFFQISEKKPEKVSSIYKKILGRLLSKSIFDNETNELLAFQDTPITPNLIRLFKQKNIQKIFIRSALTCGLNRSICQKCYGWNLSSENLVELGEAIGIIAGQSIGEPGTQLTMRTFHTGGIFTASTREQIVAPMDGSVFFPESLKTIFRRTNQGENLLLTKTAGFIFIVNDKNNDEKIKINIPKQTVLYVKNQTRVAKNTILAELVGSPKQTTQEIKNILSHLSGEIYKTKTFQNNTALWILSGQFYNIPITSYLNWYNQIPKSTYICRTKLLNRRSGIIQLVNNTEHFSQQVLFIRNNILFQDSTFLKLSSSSNSQNYILNINKYKFILNFKEKRLNNLTAMAPNQKIGTLIAHKNFTTVSGGIPRYLNVKSLKSKNNSIQTGGTLLWISEETHFINRDNRILLIKEGDKVSKNCEIFPKVFSKTEGIVHVIQKNTIIQEIIIKPGLLYKVKSIDTADYGQKVYYPGEVLFDTIEITQLSFLEILTTSSGLQILIRPIQIYEIPKPKILKTHSQLDFINISQKGQVCYSENENIKSHQPNNLINSNIYINLSYSGKVKEKIDSEFKRQQLALRNLKIYNESNENQHKTNLFTLLYTQHNNLIPWSDSIEIYPKLSVTNTLTLEVLEKIYLHKYIANNLNIVKLNLTFIIQNLQLINPGIVLGYFEILTNKGLIIVNRKLVKNEELLLVTEEDCFNIKKRNLLNSDIKDILWNKNIRNRGKILRQNKTSLLIQKGRPYFFPSGTELKLKTGDLVRKGDSIALLTFEKEITGDIVQGLPRIEQILEARKPKKLTKKETEQICKDRVKERASFLPEKAHSLFLNLSTASNLHTVLQISFYYYRYRMNAYEACYRSIKKAQGFIINSIQDVYQSQGVIISDKHLEIVIKQMSSKVKIIKKGATNLWTKELVSLHKIKYINDSIQENNKKPAGYYPILLGITKASLNSESFISAASFQETTRVLTKAAIEGKIDWLRGLKENVIIGQLIPVGTGYRTYIDVSVSQLNKKSNINTEILDLKHFFS
jgi:DNA-directed RNA polymerase subunit beta'